MGWLVEPGGQAIQMGGQMEDQEVAKYAPFADPQWCAQDCEWGFVPGTVDPSRIYEYEKTHETQHAAVYLHPTKERQVIAEAMQYVMYTIIALVSIMILYGVMYYCCFHGKNGKEHS